MRSQTMTSERAASARATLDRVDQLQTGREPTVAAVLDEAGRLTAQIERDVAAASGRDQARLRALADTLSQRIARLRQ